MKRILEFLAREKLFIALLILFIVLSIIAKPPLKRYIVYVNWDTILSLTSLLVICGALGKSRLMESMALRMLGAISCERCLVLLLVFLSFIFSMLVTNDVALFVIIPLTLNLQNHMENDLGKIIIFEAIAVNAGSMLTPMGNPQNLFLFHLWDISFFRFIGEMAPPAGYMFLLLLIFSFIFVGKKEIKSYNLLRIDVDKKLAFVSSLMLGLFIAALELDLERYFVIAVLLLYLIFFRKALKGIDWMLLLIFILMFLDVRLFLHIEDIKGYMSRINFQRPDVLYGFSLLLTQLISNVPAAIFMAKLSNNYKVIAYAVNIGGNGVLIASLANIIALRMSGRKDLFIKFHLYSIPFMLVSGVIGYLFIRYLF